MDTRVLVFALAHQRHTHKNNTKNIINLSHMFDGCSSLESIFGLYELNKNNTKKIINNMQNKKIIKKMNKSKNTKIKIY